MSQVVILLLTSKSFSPVEEKVLEIQKFFVYKRKTLDFLMSFSHGEEKTCVSFALLAVAQLF